MSRSELLKCEKELIGFYVTGHPLDDYRMALENLMPLYNLTDDNSSVQDGQIINVGGIISRIDSKVTKKGDSMAVLLLEDFSSRIEVVVFPKTYNEYSKLLRGDAVVEVEGRFSVDERGSKIIASRLALLKKRKAPSLSAQRMDGQHRNETVIDNNNYVRNTDVTAYSCINENSEASAELSQQTVTNIVTSVEGASPTINVKDHVYVTNNAVIELTVMAEKESENVTKALIAILQKHHGNTKVFLKLMGSRRRILLDSRFYVNGQGMGLQVELRNLLGNNAFRVKYM